MFFLGIDIGKNTHVASLMDDKKNVIFKAFSFSNTVEGAQSLLTRLDSFSNSLEIGMEATGHYWLSLYSFLVEKDSAPMSSIRYKPMVGDRVLKLESVKRMSSIPY